MQYTNASEFKRTVGKASRGGGIFEGAAFFPTRQAALDEAEIINRLYFERYTKTGAIVRTIPATKHRPVRYLLLLPWPITSYESTAVYNAKQHLFPT